ncbi:MAG: NAD(P)-dependent oxidoreductase [Planctomycetes bacterium]|nr:NAD(P)-dependent oxidoreductase [Planctomycetota bacterium]
MARCLVVAGRSFLGQHATARLRGAGHETLVTSRQAGPDIDCVCDLLQPFELDRFIVDSQPDWVISFAGAPRHDPDSTNRLHVEGTRNLLAAIQCHHPQARVILIGSAAEYGCVPDSRLPIDEACHPQPVSALGTSKLAQTRLAQDFAVQYELDIVSLRPFNVIGPGQPEYYLAGQLMRRLIAFRRSSQTDVITLASGDSTRDFVDVRDVADAVVSIVRDLPEERGQLRVFNVSTGQETTVRQLAAFVCEVAGGCRLVDVESQPSEIEIRRSCGDPRRIAQAVGWKPSVHWQDSIRDAWSLVQERAECL